MATTVDEVKQIRDKAEAMRMYARQAQYTLEMQNMCAEIKLRAERRLGEMLQETRIAERGENNLLRGRTMRPRDEGPLLADLGVPKSQSSRCQIISRLSNEQFEKRIQDIKGSGKELSSRDMVDFAKYLMREQTRASEQRNGAEAGQQTSAEEKVRIIHGDFRAVLTTPLVENDSTHMILTDPPYGKEFLPVWKELGKFAVKVLKPGKLLIAYSGNYHLPTVMSLLSENLQYVWTGVLLNGTQPDTVFPRHIMTYWKPVLLFSKGEYRPAEKKEWFKDLIHGDGRSKCHHNWEQGIGEATHLIKALTHEGNLIVDPFLGSGTNALASKKLNRRFIGCDVDEKAVGIALHRICESR
ncbi:MAG: DNA methyltransferase [Desulfomonilaceae bacterium]